MEANPRYKASLFSLLFANPDTLRELYGALEGVSLPRDVPVTINTLSEVLFLDRINDISFTVGDKLVVLIEHQSTVNPNMALRLLIYAARIYEKIVGDRNIYSTRLLTIPRPEFFVLYNGTAPCPDEQTLRLSDSFERDGEGLPPGLSGKEAPALELTLRVLNINRGRNEGLARRCAVLGGYSAFVAKVRDYEKETGDRAEAIRLAVKYCREQDILKEFLEENSSEVMNMVMTEWNWDDALAVRYEEGWEGGLERGLEQGLEQGMERGLEQGMERGFEQGIEQGLEQGMERGLEQGMERGLEQGREKREEEIARSLKALGLDVDQITTATGLSPEQIAAL